jgi:hypothetical protein
MLTGKCLFFVFDQSLATTPDEIWKQKDYLE